MAQNRAPQFQPYSGAIPPSEQFPAGEYLEVRRLGVETLNNEALAHVWDTINREVQGLTSTPAAGQDEITRDFVEDVLRSIDRIFESVSVRVVTRAQRIFDSCFGGPANYSLLPYGIRWPGEDRFALSVALKFVAAAFQVPQVRSNSLDRGILENHAWVILAPLYNLKAQLMRENFGLEIRGEISPDELDAMFRGAKIGPPISTSLTDREDTSAERAAEDEAAMGVESALVPTAETIEAVHAGSQVWTWQPTEANWATFAEMNRRRESTAPLAVPGVPFPMGNTVGSGSSSSAGGATSPGGLETPG